ncbi:hypothetical protein RRG08_004305 [Elysia crispata]|uniref:Uncharacterized protein n=1 Tax=Elysia crispata TaxID=231223 RepID=A0AAE0YBY6_9GAST|nr:hypothetical protein RRG08_004305 [Elysia crispata]
MSHFPGKVLKLLGEKRGKKSYCGRVSGSRRDRVMRWRSMTCVNFRVAHGNKTCEEVEFGSLGAAGEKRCGAVTACVIIYLIMPSLPVSLCF